MNLTIAMPQPIFYRFDSVLFDFGLVISSLDSFQVVLFILCINIKTEKKIIR